MHLSSLLIYMFHFGDGTRSPIAMQCATNAPSETGEETWQMLEIGFNHECLHFGDTENVKIKSASSYYVYIECMCVCVVVVVVENRSLISYINIFLSASLTIAANAIAVQQTCCRRRNMRSNERPWNGKRKKTKAYLVCRFNYTAVFFFPSFFSSSQVLCRKHSF